MQPTENKPLDPLREKPPLKLTRQQRREIGRKIKPKYKKR